MISRRSIMFAGGMLPLLLAGCAGVLPSASRPLPEDGTIDLMSLLNGLPNAKLFTAAFKRSGLSERVGTANGPVTVFVPTDEVLEALPPAQRAILTDTATDQTQLRAAVGGLCASGQLRLESIAVRQGHINTWTTNQQLRVTGAPAATARIQRAVLANGRTTVSGPQVGFARADILASNGVIHLLNGALLP